MSLATQVAQAVVVELAGHEFSQQFEPKMLVLPDFKPVELEILRVSVAPRTLEIERQTRSSTKYIVIIDIGIQKRIEGTPEDTVATMGTLVDEIAEFLHTRDLSQFPAAQLVNIVNEPLYVPEHLQQKQSFTSILSLKYVLFG